MGCACPAQLRQAQAEGEGCPEALRPHTAPWAAAASRRELLSTER